MKKTNTQTLLGDVRVSLRRFEKLDPLFKSLGRELQSASEQQRLERVGKELLQLIQQSEAPCFLLGAVVDFIDKVNRTKLLDAYTFSNFELWLNQFSGLTSEENYAVRGKIVGKAVPREEYQLLFPIGMGRVHVGTHFVTAHGSPDLDTTISSFWGWVDAFGARVGEGLHVWNVPGGPPASSVEITFLFEQFFGEGIFTHVAKTRSVLSLSGLDLVSQKKMVKKQPHEPSLMIDPDREQHAIVIVDAEGYYLGDWRHFDVEGVRQIILSLNNCLRWFQSFLNIRLIALFGKTGLTLTDLPPFLRALLDTRLIDAEPAKEFTDSQKRYVDGYLMHVLGVSEGLQCRFEVFAAAMCRLQLFGFQEFIDHMASLESHQLFDRAGKLLEDRPRIFHFLEKIIQALDRAIQSVRIYEESLSVALSIKRDVFGHTAQVVSYRAEVDEIRSKIDGYPYLTVTSSESQGRSQGKLVPLGVIHAMDLHKPILGSVSLRDFCNREETKIPSYLEVISVIDHHRSALQTSSAATVLISDAQSSNALVAQLAFQINDLYSIGAMTVKEIESQIEQGARELGSSECKRRLQRLLQRHMAARRGSGYFVDPQREFVEYLHFLYGIFDDTDLLTKVSTRDVECVVSLMNRLKSLAERREVEILSLDDLPRDEQYAQRAAKRILQHPDTYSLYRKVYHAKEEGVEHNLLLCVQGKPSSIFADTKEQNGCCRVGQTKIFAKNYPSFHKHTLALRALWLERAREVWQERGEVDLHLHMISTIAGAEDLYAGQEGHAAHKDEIWLWIPPTEPAVEHLKSFLNALRAAPHVVHTELEVSFLGANADQLKQLFAESFIQVPCTVYPEEMRAALPMAVLRFRAGAINSRKAMISPYLPRLLD